MRQDGLTLIELLVVMAIIAVAFTVLATGAISNLRGTATSRAQTEVKGVAVKEMERIANATLYVDRSTSTPNYAFDWYYKNCLGSTLPASCEGTDSTKGTSWTITSEKDSGTTKVERFSSEGLILISVKATSATGGSYSITKRISCYDVYPAPSTSAPAPCPDATDTTPAGL